MADRPRIVGIDLGTTNTLVASVRNRIPKIVPTDRGNLILPSVVALSAKNDLLVGGVAKDQMVTNPKNTLWGTKRLIGRKYHSKAVEDLKGYFPYDIVEDPNGDTAVTMGGKLYTLPQVSSFVLSQLKTIAEQFLGGPIDAAVISVPAYYNDNQRNAVKEAGRLAGFDVKRIVNEPTAAALAYGFNRGLDQKVLVYDLGGGTFDVSVLHLAGNVFEVLATGGDSFLGGADFDNRIMEYVLERFRDETKVDLTESPIALQRIKNAAEAAKIDLTLIPNVVIDLPYIEERKGKPLDLRIPLTRDYLNNLTGDLVDRTFDICDRVLAEKGISRSEIDEIILVGGQSRMPLVQQKIQAHFGKAPRKGVHPDECVALGAALLGDSLGSIDAVTLLDALSMPIGYAMPNGRVKRIIEKNSLIPMVKSFRLPPPQQPGAQFIELDIYQGDSDLMVDNEYLGTVRVPAAAAGRKIDFRLTEECLLQVQVEDASGMSRKVDLATRDTPEQLKKALQEVASRNTPAAPSSSSGPSDDRGLFSSIKSIFRRG
ncbi:Hsp70 family protein [Corallococcus exiguus]|uniref:Hsp70 family protein n=1 Tax=Corallococcus exiguus TaxID=83462 RepID=A0A7X4Y6Z3_9BACT|nr:MULTISPECIES: Hsp70 family protein [Corallococcus]NBC40029.1 Hsp70 family protein [Corallococcus exiguus]NNC21739.1 Hsp70 family protein [Corallococcus exiguus]NRD55719.1 Hsp70 family protein [Corallococcus exiguus]RKH15273.1 2-alkenal reductase [Corallococcus sp. CA041A]RKH96398.1 2-alkenal reductase [Corallococcus sp. AB030]